MTREYSIDGRNITVHYVKIPNGTGGCGILVTGMLGSDALYDGIPESKTVTAEDLKWLTSWFPIQPFHKIKDGVYAYNRNTGKGDAL